MKVAKPPFDQDLRRLLPRGTAGQIAAELGLSPQAVGLALKVGKPGHPAVQRALQIAQQSGALAAAQALARLSSPAA